MQRPDWIIMDIEGTTTSIHFVHDVLFPYARKQIGHFILGHQDKKAVQICLKQCSDFLEKTESLKVSGTDLLPHLLRWIDEDRKYAPLKELQGMIWQHGYQQGDYTAHLYEDVLPNWNRWKTCGIRLAIYSSGSVMAQQLLFSHTCHGNLSSFISAHYDTRIGNKKEPSSYKSIATSLQTPVKKLYFLSDSVSELEAAQEAGLNCFHIVRPGSQPSDFIPAVSDFNEISDILKQQPS
ncbi:MAG: acireductone synthase [Deltaproteobacteria bacterium]|nr:acireductone synthase [Deltaproteobacteria bacterium]